MIDERDIHALPVNTLDADATPPFATRCYSVQIPVVSYHNVPLQIPSIPMHRMQDGIEISYARQEDGAKRGETVGNVRAVSTPIDSRTRRSKESGDGRGLVSTRVPRVASVSRASISHDGNFIRFFFF